MYELIIIGGGPAGLAASVYAARKRLKTLLVAGDIGGQVNLTRGVENYLGYQLIPGHELISRFKEQVDKFPIDQKIGYKISGLVKVDGGFEAVTENGEQFSARAILIATGKRSRRLNVPGEAELIGRGVSYCAICDGPIFAGQRVAVIGGGNSALEAALDMVKIAEWVELVSITPLTGDPILIDKLSAAKNLTIFLEHEVERVVGTDIAEGIVIRNMHTGETSQLDVGGVFVEVGLVPNSEPFKGMVKLNSHGEIEINCLSQTDVPGIYAAGDVTSVPEKQIVVAAGEGAKAALQAHRYLQRLTV
jgi:alkyl hydroperoxide reductase subunit F